MTTKPKTKTITARRKDAENRVAELKAHAEAVALEKTVALLESPQAVPVPWSEYPQFDDFNRFPSGLGSYYVWSDVDDRTEGRYRPLYETTQDLMMIRASGRKCKEFFPIANGALSSLTSYVIATGYEYKFQAKIPGGEQLATSLQPILDRFLERNDFIGRLDQQIHEDSRTDGEVFAALYPDQQDIRVELIPPECVLRPQDPSWIERQCGTSYKINNWWHGVHTLHDLQLKRDDITRPLGYHVVFDRMGDEWDYLSALRVEHIKRNVCQWGRRGVSDFWIILQDLEAEAKLRRNTAVGAAILAAIVLLRQHAEGASKSSVEAMVTNAGTGTRQKPLLSGSSRTTSVENVSPGTVKDAPHGMQWMMGPMGSLNSPVYMEVDQFLMRVIGLRWNMPEYMISGDASNANFASTQQAGTPFVRARERDQSFYGSHFDSLIWKAMRLYHKDGQLGGTPWEVIRRYVGLKAEYQTPENRDPAEKIATDEKLSNMGIKSKRTIATDHGLDYDEEQKSITSEPKQPAPVVDPSTGLPVGGGSPFGRPNGFNPRAAFGARTESLAIRAMDVLMERSEGEGRWVTLDNGAKVRLDSEGNVVSGPPSLKGKALKGSPAAKAKRAKAVADKGDPRSFANEKDADKFGKEMHGKWASSLKKGQKETIGLYQNGWHRGANEALRRGAELDSDRTKLVKGLDVAIASAPPTSEPFVTYRGLTRLPEGRMKVGATITDKGFVSTSLNESVASGEAFQDTRGALLKITVPKGSRGAYIDAHRDINEQEFLMPRNTKMRITKIEPVGKKKLIHVEVLND